MGLVYDKHDEEMKSLHNFLMKNKMDFTQFVRSVNFIHDMTQE